MYNLLIHNLINLILVVTLFCVHIIYVYILDYCIIGWFFARISLLLTYIHITGSQYFTSVCTNNVLSTLYNRAGGIIVRIF